jgi:peroxisomal 2,4-dienoyl-CoA reductase
MLTLLHSAGAAGNFLAPLTGLSANAFKSVIDIDVIGSFNTLKATLPYLIESAKRNPNTAENTSTGGRIIFVSATLHYIGTPFQTHVVAAKAGVDALAGNAAIELGPRGITSNVIAPGPIAGTEGMERLTGDAGRAQPGKGVPLGRYGTVKEIADATVYLFSDTGNYVNGETLIVDGGSWRAPMMGMGSDFPYPESVLIGQIPKGAKTGREEKSKL